MRGHGIFALVLLTSCSEATSPVEKPFDYHGLQLHFPSGTVDVKMAEAGSGPYARLSPSGFNKKSGYFIDLGRPRTGSRSSGLLWLGFYSFRNAATKTDIGEGYMMVCEGPSKQVQTCGVFLRELPNAALNFVIGPKLDVPTAREVVREAEAYLRAAKRPKKIN